MPKVFASPCERKVAAFRSWYRGKRAEKNVTQTDLARELDLAQASVSAKLQVKGNNQTKITYEDLLILFRVVDATDEEILRFMRLGG
jgi:transcriptional regulator with XRE-family HTH domain